jgi:PAS domain S-box-containing protein
VSPDDDAAAELERLRARNKKLAEDKSWFQLVLRLMEMLNPLAGLEGLVQGLLTNIVECIGGTNIKLYYWIGQELHYRDFFGEKKHMTTVDDPDVARVIETHNFVERRGGPADALLMEGMLRASYTWAFPLLVGQDLIGVIKLENLHVHGASLGRYLPTFCSHAALILGNEIRNTIQRRSDEALRTATERLRLATEAGIIGIWDWDIEHDDLVWDESMYRLYGRQKGDFGGAYEAWISAVHPADKALADGEIQAALRGEREYAPEFRVVWPDGSVRHIKAASRTIRNELGKPVRMVGINYDLTDRKQAEEVQRRLNRELRAISTCNQALIRAEDEQTLLVDVCRIICDEAGYRMAWVGYAEHDEAKTIRPVAWAGVEEGYLGAAGITWADTPLGRGPSGAAIRSGMSAGIDDFASDPKAAPWREGALQRGYRSSIALPLQDQSGTTFGVLCIYATEPGAFIPGEVRLMEELAGDLAFGIIALRTRAERTRAEEEIRKLNDELEQRVLERTTQLAAANKDLESFCYSVSHDLRAPLRHVDGFVQLLRRRLAGVDDEQTRRYLDIITDGARRMGQLIDDLLSFSRMARGEMSRQSVDMAALAHEVKEELAPEAKGRVVHWRLGALPVVTGDRAMLRVVFVNLMANAVKFTGRRAEAVIEVGCEEHDREIVVFVRDNGVGFDMRHADKLFGVFQRLHDARDFAGTGIGLANVHRIVSRHGGRTWAEGHVDRGATFYFSLPRASGP